MRFAQCLGLLAWLSMSAIAVADPSPVPSPGVSPAPLAANAPKAPREGTPAPTPGVQPAAVINVWPDGKMPGTASAAGEHDAPARPDGVERITDISKPTLTVYLAPKTGKPNPAMIVSPGGGYTYVTYNKEGTEVANWLNTNGFTAIILKYRTPQNRGGAFQDIQRALRLVRAHAGEWNIDPKRLGVIGFSAGGHLSAKASNLFDKPSYSNIDDVDKQSARPDFAVLVYPAYLDDKNGHVAPDFDFTVKMPPTLIIHNADDKIFSPGSKLYDAALTAAGEPHVFKFYATGGHGYALRSLQDVKVWPQDALAWLKQIGVLQ